MKLSDFVREVNRIYPNKDPEIKIVTPYNGFQSLDNVYCRESYHDTNFFGTEFEKGDFIVIDPFN